MAKSKGQPPPSMGTDRPGFFTGYDGVFREEKDMEMYYDKGGEAVKERQLTYLLFGGKDPDGGGLSPAFVYSFSGALVNHYGKKKPLCCRTEAKNCDNSRSHKANKIRTPA